jgi:hypothetical protein
LWKTGAKPIQVKKVLTVTSSTGRNCDANISVSHNRQLRFDIFPLTLVHLLPSSGLFYGISTYWADGPDPTKGISVAYILYREHTIVSSAIYDDVSGKWQLTACVSWQANGDQIQFLKNSLETFAHFERGRSGWHYVLKELG